MSDLPLRERFNNLRRSLRWTWADIDRITGRRQTSTNISKGVPNWARLAIVADEKYQQLLQLHLIDAVRLRLDYEWTLVQRSPAVYTFITPYSANHRIMLTFAPGRFMLSGNAKALSSLCEEFRLLYPDATTEKDNDGYPGVAFKLLPKTVNDERLSTYLDEHALSLEL
jgi:hypothetical protein